MTKRRILLILSLLLAVMFIGTAGYRVLLHVGLIDAFYMTVITISTVGYGEVATMTDTAKLFSVFVIFAGLSVFGYGITSLISLFFEGEVRDVWRRKRMDAKIRELKDHYIVCGAGDVGTTVIKSFRDHEADFIVVEENEKRAEELRQAGVLVIEGDATNEDTLQQAGIHRARGVACALSTDEENVFAVLTCRQMNEDILIVTKAVEPSAHGKLLKAGANKTISPNEIGGQRIATLISRPSVISFLDVITRAGDVALDLEEVLVSSHSGLAGKMLLEAKIPEQTGLIVLALKKSGEATFRFNPSSSETLQAGDTMVVLGPKEKVERLRSMVDS